MFSPISDLYLKSRFKDSYPLIYFLLLFHLGIVSVSPPEIRIYPDLLNLYIEFLQTKTLVKYIFKSTVFSLDYFDPYLRDRTYIKDRWREVSKSSGRTGVDSI